ncbi:polysaccharide deacetylase family protein [Kitasatospora sp. NBC_01287]|uniref:polysaccharide deacetylase family protein n=1 Tax=Kitasatospora sp. NBC_01287 TaxID=2903573 RepID=UPI00224EBAEB|nr:polysaccharide deacetylase family protein [Kitasatospora sp. NBC_01287]MCX4749928.1 polysaccharide deacetylase family protein [Kitasatospora sp. NBC_01287]
MTAVPVLLYHSVSVDPPAWIAPYTVRPRDFIEQLDRLADSGRTVVPLRRLVAAQRGGAPLPEHSAVLTFDDGFADFYWTVAPLLSERGLPATLYLTTGALHPPGEQAPGSLLPGAEMLNWRQVATIDAYGFELGGHTRTHPQLDTLPRGRLGPEIAGCKEELEEALGHPLTSFAYPHGYSSATVRRRVQLAGWTSACAVANTFSSQSDDPLRIARLMVRADTSTDQFQQWLDGRGAPVAPVAEKLTTKGWRLYRRARAAVGSPVGGPPTD